jgi:anti-sigma factor ChrR (cupin superfamily)
MSDHAVENKFDSRNQPAHLLSHYIDVKNMPWAAAQFPGIEFKLLFSDPSTGMSTILFKMQPGAVVPLHTHMGVEQTYMLEGSLEDDEGKAFEGDFVWRPGGHRHIAVSPKGATFISIFTKPNVFDSGVKFFTEK